MREQLSAYLDGEMAPEERTAFEARLAGEPELQRDAAAWRRVDVLYSGMAPVQAPAGLEDRVRDAVSPGVVRFRRRHASPQRLWPMLAAAAGVAVMLGLFALQLSTPAPVAPGSTQLAKHAPAAAPKAPDIVSEARSGVPAQPAPQIATPKAEPRTEEVFMLDMEAAEAPISAPAPPPAEMAATGPLRQDISTDAALPDANSGIQEKDEAKSSLQNVSVGGSLRIRSNYQDFQEVEQPAPPPPVRMAEPPAPAAAPLPAVQAEGLNAKGALKSREEAVVVETDVPRTLGHGREEAQGASMRRTAAGREFFFVEDVWRESAYANEQAHAVRRNGVVYRLLIQKEPRLNEIARLGKKVIVRIDNTWYLITDSSPAQE